MSWFCSKPRKPKSVVIGKATVVIKTLTADEYRVPITGSYLGGDWKVSVEGEYKIRYRDTSSQFIQVGGGKSIPICNVKEMWLEDLDPNYAKEF